MATLGSGDPPKFVVIDSIQTMWSDAIESAPGTVEPGARLGAGADPLRQGERRGLAAGRACDQGRPDRWPARRRAHGRCGLLVRGRRRARLPPAAGGQEPVRRDRRGRRVRNDRRRPRRGAEPLRAVPGRPRRRGQSGRGGLRRRRRARARFWSRSRLWSPRRRSARRAAPSSAGSRAASPWCSRCSRPTGA